MKRFDEFENDFDDQSGGEGGEGHGGKSGTVSGPRIGLEISRDDLLAPSEIRRLLKAHEEIHKGYVDKQKISRQDRAALKEGKKTLNQTGRMGLGGGGAFSPYKKHPIQDHAQFSGIDRQVSADPSKFDAKTNKEQQHQNDLKYNLTHQPKPTFNPKPMGPF